MLLISVWKNTEYVLINIVKDVYPEWAEKIDVFMPDEQARRLGQSVAAAQIPVIKKR